MTDDISLEHQFSDWSDECTTCVNGVLRESSRGAVCDIPSFTTLRLNKQPLTPFFLTNLPLSSQFIFTSSRLVRKFFHYRQKQIHLAIKHPLCGLHEHETLVRSMFIISGCKACIHLSISVINDFRCSIHACVINKLFH